MEPKKRRLLVAAIAVTIIVGIFASFGLPFFSSMPTIALADELTPSPDGESTNPISPDGNFLPISVEPKTVQAVVETLKREDTYYRSLSIEHIASKTSTTTVHIWKQGSLEKASMFLPNGTVQNRLSNLERICFWNGGDRSYHSVPANREYIDLAQGIPSYEDVLLIDPATILEADYEEKNGQDCVYLLQQDLELSYLISYWISVETGLLVASETQREGDGTVIYRMTETSVRNDISSDLEQDPNLFRLPDGTQLH